MNAFYAHAPRINRLMMGGLLIFSLSACSSASVDSTAGLFDSEGDFTVSLSRETQAHLCGGGGVLTAELVVDGGTPTSLDVDCTNGTVTGSVSGLSPETHTFVINYYIDGVLVATATTDATVVAGEAVSVVFDQTMLLNVGGNWNEIKWNLGNWS